MSSAPPRSLEPAAKDVVRLPIDDTGDEGILGAVEVCACGSGRKWKRCHGMERPLELVR